MSVPSWAETLLRTALRRHGNDPRAMRRALAEFQKACTLYDPQETQDAYAFIVAGMKARIAELDPVAEAERGP